MHPYATNLKERHAVPLVIAALAIAASWLLSVGIAKLQWNVPFWVELPSVAGVYGAGYELFRRKLWRWQLFRWPGWVQTPIVAGTWKGVVITSFDQNGEQHPIDITIQQNWTDMVVKLKSRYSTSRSLIGGLLVNDENVVTYEYVNEPLPGAAPTMHAHRGTARLTISSEGTRLEGEYYSGRDRANQGILRLELVD